MKLIIHGQLSLLSCSWWKLKLDKALLPVFLWILDWNFIVHHNLDRLYETNLSLPPSPLQAQRSCHQAPLLALGKAFRGAPSSPSTSAISSPATLPPPGQLPSSSPSATPACHADPPWAVLTALAHNRQQVSGPALSKTSADTCRFHHTMQKALKGTAL